MRNLFAMFHHTFSLDITITFVSTDQIINISDLVCKEFFKKVSFGVERVLESLKAYIQPSCNMWIRFIVVASLMLAVTAFSSEDYKVKGLEQFGLTNDDMYSGYMPLKVFVESLFNPRSSTHLLLNLSSLLFPPLNSFLTSTFINNLLC